MSATWAEENLKTIRTLMERSSLYRRALAPIMFFAGLVGVLVAAAGLVLKLNSILSFSTLWMGSAVFVVAGCFLIAHKQAGQEKEEFWTPPTRRVAQALAPSLSCGLIVGLFFVVENAPVPMILALLWSLLYGCALQAAGFFITHGIKRLGWIYIGLAALGLALCHCFPSWLDFGAHWTMGILFGGLQLLYSAYLYLTERTPPLA